MAGTPTVLHMEDLGEIRDVVRVVLERSGYRVTGAENADEGLRLAREHQPSVILLDTLMPGPGGDAVVRRLREDPATAVIPVILTPAAPREEAARQAREAGCHGVVAKPMDGSDIVREVARVLAGGSLDHEGA